jgi:CHAT domain-containing protein
LPIFEKRHPRADKLLAIAKPNVPPYPFLYFAVEEVQAAATLYDAKTLINENATESSFKATAHEFELIHIAAHSDYIPSNPMFSAILLGEGNDEDGRLETHEIFDLDLSATDLIVLSACETHLGNLGSGDELIGLERAFIRAGSPSLVTTLWSVDDAATAKLMSRFYTELKAGSPKAEALRLAQLEISRDYPNPYYWAGFVLVGYYGESQSVNIESNEQQLFSGWIFAVITIVLLGIFVLLSLRRGVAKLVGEQNQ